MPDTTDGPLTGDESEILAQLTRRRHSVWALRAALPNLPPNEAYLALADTLERLLHRGAIFASDIRGGAESRFFPARLELESSADCDMPHLIVGLTPRGGELWETDAQPDWSQLVTVTPEYLTFDQRWHIHAADRDTIERHLRQSRISPSHIFRDATWDTVASWEIAYWKTLPIAHRCRFQLTCRGKERIRDLCNVIDLM